MYGAQEFDYFVVCKHYGDKTKITILDSWEARQRGLDTPGMCKQKKNYVLEVIGADTYAQAQKIRKSYNMVCAWMGL